MDTSTMNTDDNLELIDAEENERQEFNEQTNYLPLSVAGKVQKTVFAVGKIGSVCLIVVLLAMFLVQVSHFGVTIKTLVQLNREPGACEPCTGQSSALTGAGFSSFDRNVTAMLHQILQTTGDSAQKLIEIVGTLSNIESTGTDTAGVIDDILLVVNQLRALENGSSSFALPSSCEEIKRKYPHSPSGMYLLAHPISGKNYYCNMGELCGSGGGWTRLAYLNMNDSTANCPSGFRLYQSGGVRACGRPPSSSAGCVSVQFPSNGISYSQVCGRVVGYQFGSTDATNLYYGNTTHNSNINYWYVDGVSITRGSPRKHVWTLMAGYSSSLIKPFVKCPCSNESTTSVQSFVGDDYFCESGNPTNALHHILYTSDPLWDGQDCGPVDAACCSVPGIPWFHRDYGNTTTTDYLELRVCSDEPTYNEDVPVSYYEIYVQ